MEDGEPHSWATLGIEVEGAGWLSFCPRAWRDGKEAWVGSQRSSWGASLYLLKESCGGSKALPD